MGTNFFVRPANACPVRCDRWIHIGKSSLGWAFQFRAYPERPEWDRDDIVTWPVTDYASWLKLLGLGEIYDEYGRATTRDQLLTLIERHRSGRSTLERDDYHDDAGNTFITGWFS